VSEKDTKDVLDMLLARLHCDESNPYARLSRNWMEIVGPDLAPHMKIMDVRGHSLVLVADHPAWTNLVLLRKRQIIARVQAQYPQLDITQLQIRMGR